MVERGFGTGKQGAAHGVAMSLTSPCFLRVETSSLTKAEWAGEVRIGGLLTGGPKVWISNGATSAAIWRSSRSKAKGADVVVDCLVIVLTVVGWQPFVDDVRVEF